MRERLPRVALVVEVVVALWISDHVIVPWVQCVAGEHLVGQRGRWRGVVC